VWDRKDKVKIPAVGVFADSTEANAWIRRNAAKTGHKQNEQKTFDVITVNVQA
jgi:hypothetical protein